MKKKKLKAINKKTNDCASMNCGTLPQPMAG